MRVVHCTVFPNCMQFANSAVFYALHVVVQPRNICVLHVVDSMNANANCELVPHYWNVMTCGCELNSQTSCTIIYYWCAMGLYSHVALSHCAFSTSLRDFNTLYDQPICYQRWTCFHLHLDSTAITICYMHEGSCFSDHFQMYIVQYQSVIDKTMSNQLLMER